MLFMEKEKKIFTGKRKWIIIISLIGTTLIGSYFGVAFYFSNHFLPGTYVDGILCEYADAQDTLSRLNHELSEYSLLVKGIDGKQDILENLTLETASEEGISSALASQDNLLWIVNSWSSKNLNVEINVLLQEEELRTKIKELDIYGIGDPIPPTNAYIGPYNSETKSYEIVEGVTGTLFDEEQVYATILHGVQGLEKEVDLIQAGCLVSPEIMANDETLQSNITRLNQYVRTVIDYDWHGTIERLDGDIIHTWILSTQDGYILDKEALTLYLQEKAQQYDTYGKPHEFWTTNGRAVQLACRSMGWKVNVEEEVQTLSENILNGECVAREPSWSYKAPGKGGSEVGTTYVEIDLGNQHLYLYVKGELILETDLVSGNVEKGHKTPTGIFLLTYKTTDAVLRGDDYESPVKYWMPFNGNIGMHDASWRDHFGGEIYKTNGSHGCINLPLKSAETIYEYIYTGLPIICYY